jgi:hypothetical protein
VDGDDGIVFWLETPIDEPKKQYHRKNNRALIERRKLFFGTRAIRRGCFFVVRIKIRNQALDSSIVIIIFAA